MKGLSITMKCRSIDIAVMDRLMNNADKIAICIALIDSREELDHIPNCCSDPPSYHSMVLVSEELQRVVSDLRLAADEFRDQIHAIDEEVL